MNLIATDQPIEEHTLALVPPPINLMNLDYIWNRVRFSPGDPGGQND